MFFSESDILRLRQNVEALTGVSLPEVIRAEAGEGLRVTLDGELTIIAEDLSALSRGMTLAAHAVREGHETLNTAQRRRFHAMGPMLDVSRGAVLTVDAVKREIDRVSALGMNLMMLYAEDVYALKDYPYFGHLRGRYRAEDLIELDRYAASMGVELVPCIQTLGHLSQFLQWAAQRDMADQPAVLMIDDEEVYQFIEAQIAEMRRCFTSKRIHIGMDEAHGVGLGRYFEKHGVVDRFDLLTRHLSRVDALCRKYDFAPMMWSDMFFRLGSKTNDYYDQDAVVPDRVGAAIPEGIELVYWDYYHEDEATYDLAFERHQKLAPTVFAGGIWTWSGFLPHVKRTLATMLPGLRAAARAGVGTVLATMWGDDGAETPLALADALLPVISEVGWLGDDCAAEDIRAMGECVSGLPWAVVEAFSQLYPTEKDVRTGKAILWCDPLYPLVPGGEDALNAAIARAEAAQPALRANLDALECRYASAVFDAVADKAALLRDVRRAYRAGDRDALEGITETLIPAAVARYAALMAQHRALWMRDCLPFGWEILCQRYGGAMARLTDVRATIRDYLDGRIDAIAELEEPELDPARADGAQFHQNFVSASASRV